MFVFFVHEGVFWASLCGPSTRCTCVLRSCKCLLGLFSWTFFFPIAIFFNCLSVAARVTEEAFSDERGIKLDVVVGIEHGLREIQRSKNGLLMPRMAKQLLQHLHAAQQRRMVENTHLEE